MWLKLGADRPFQDIRLTGAAAPWRSLSRCRFGAGGPPFTGRLAKGTSRCRSKRRKEGLKIDDSFLTRMHKHMDIDNENNE